MNGREKIAYVFRKKGERKKNKIFAGKMSGASTVIFSIAMAHSSHNFFLSVLQCHFQSYRFFFIRIVRHFVIVALPLPLTHSNPIRHLLLDFFLSWIVRWKPLKILAIMTLFHPNSLFYFVPIRLSRFSINRQTDMTKSQGSANVVWSVYRLLPPPPTGFIILMFFFFGCLFIFLLTMTLKYINSILDAAMEYFKRNTELSPLLNLENQPSKFK